MHASSTASGLSPADGHWCSGAYVKPYAGTTRAPHIWPEIWGTMTRKAKKAEFDRFERALAREKALGVEGQQKWVRYDLQTSSHLGTLPGGPVQDAVLRRVSISLVSGELLDDEDLSGASKLPLHPFAGGGLHNVMTVFYFPKGAERLGGRYLDRSGNSVQVKGIRPAAACPLDVAVALASSLSDSPHRLPAMPCLPAKHAGSQRVGGSSDERRRRRYSAYPVHPASVPVYEALVARPVGKHEMATVPEAIAAVKTETDRLMSLPTWDHNNPRPLRRVLEEAKRDGKVVHIGALFYVKVFKGEELPKGHPGRKYTARMVFFRVMP